MPAGDRGPRPGPHHHPATVTGVTVASLPTCRLGRTEHRSSRAVLGGAAFWDATPTEAEGPFHDAIARGVNHLDIAPQYGRAEAAVGAHIPAVRDRLFVAAKTLRSHPDGVRAQLEDSLRTLGCDHLDLYQAHGVTDLEDLDRRSPALEAICAARAEGIVRFAGITGHDLGTARAQLQALRRFDLDTVMFPCFPRLWADPGYRADAEALLDECARRDVGVMVIKAVAWRPWGDDPKEPGSPWYRPYRSPEAVRRGVRFALSTPGVHALCTPGDLRLLPLVLDEVGAYEPLDEAARDATIAAMADEPLIFPLAVHAR